MMWWTNWTVPKEYTAEEVRDPSDVYDNAMKLFKDRPLMYPCQELMDATHLFIKQSIYDIRNLPSWHKSRVCLIGDSAHAVSTHLPTSLILGVTQFRSRGFVGIGGYVSTCLAPHPQ